MAPGDNAELRESIRKSALLNAAKHEGKAQAGAVIGKILGEKPDLRGKVKEISALVNEITQEVNKLSSSEQKRIVEEKWPQALLKEKVEEEKRLPPLPNADKYAQIVTRFSPNPDCVLHLGSARAIILCHEYTRTYKGKFILRFEDTDPRLKRTALEFYDLIREDLAWLGCKPNDEYIQSDRIPVYYDHAQRLLKQGNAYICTCQPDQFRERILAGQPCDLPQGDGIQRSFMEKRVTVIGSERHESRRIDRQLRGRCARQGDPGSSRFYVSLEDDLMRLFGS